MQTILLDNKTIFVTGAAGFIVSNLVLRLFKEMSEGTIVGLDNLNDYYDPTLKDYRLSEIEKAKPAGIEYVFVKGDLADKTLMMDYSRSISLMWWLILLHRQVCAIVSLILMPISRAT